MSGTPATGARETQDRLHTIYGAVARHDDSTDSMRRVEAICRTCLDVLSVSGSGIMLMAQRTHQGTLFATDDRIGALEDLQNAAGEGPCLDSYELGRPVFAPDLQAGGDAWPLLSATALKAGIAALFSFPLQLDDSSLGALDLYRDTPGSLTDDEIADARLLAAMATREVLALQAEAVPGSLPAAIGDLSGDRTAIEQATGMVAAQTNTDVVKAGRRLRTEAAAQSRPLAEAAYDVVARVLRFS